MDEVKTHCFVVMTWYTSMLSSHDNSVTTCCSESCDVCATFDPMPCLVLLQCREDEQDQIELLTIKEEESEVDISYSNLQGTSTKESKLIISVKLFYFMPRKYIFKLKGILSI